MLKIIAEKKHKFRESTQTPPTGGSFTSCLQNTEPSLVSFWMKAFGIPQKLAVTVFLLTTSVRSEPIPDTHEIGSDSFDKRQQATLNLMKWATREKENAIEPILRLYFTSKDPEFRARLYWILEDIRINHAKSYLGLSYVLEKSPVATPKKIMLSVKRLKSGGPAESGGLTVGDKIISVSGQSFNEDMTKSDIRALLGNLPGGKKVTFTILRAGNKIGISIRPQTVERKAEDIAAAEQQFQSWMRQREKEFFKQR